MRDYIQIGAKRIIFINPDEKIVNVVDESRRLSFYDFDEEVEFIEGVMIKITLIIEFRSQMIARA